MSILLTSGIRKADFLDAFSGFLQSHPRLFAFLLVALLIWVLPALILGLLLAITEKNPPPSLFKVGIHSPESIAIVLAIFSAPFMAYGIPPLLNMLLQSNWLLLLISLVGLLLYALFHPDKIWELLNTDPIFKDVRS